MFKTLSTFHIIIYLLLGLVMSSFMTGVFGRYGLPEYYELIYLPALYFLRKDFKFLHPIGRQFKPLVIVWGILLALALVLGNFSMGGILSVARSYLLIILFLSIGMNIKMDKKFYTILFLISLGSIIGWILLIQGKLTGIFPWGENELLFAFYGNLLSIPVSISLVFAFFPNIFLILLVLAINVVLTFTAGLRRQILTSAVSFVLYYTVYFLRNAAVKTLIPVIIIIVGLVSALPIIEEQVADISPLLHRRIFEKTEDFGNTDSDDTRESNIARMFDDAGSLILPHGFVSKRTSYDEGTGRFVDTPVYELSYTFGMPLVFVFFIFFIVRVIKLFLAYAMYKTPPLSVWFVCGAVFLILLFVDGSMLSWTYTVPFTGLILGAVIRYGDRKRMKEINYYNE